jgi:6-phosphogluconate dehydrogenase
MLMVKAGSPVDDLITSLLSYLEKGDILIDGGNSNYDDTSRRVQELKSKGVLFIGTGISGGEEGARHGPSIMPGGDKEAWPYVKDIFQAIAAKVETGEPCCDWVGEEGAGHYVKMVHNGIEYGDMQLICEAYHLLSVGLGLNADQLHEVFRGWNQGELKSYLIEITSEIFAFKEKNGTPLVEEILDVAGQKGTGKWTVVNALDFGMPLTLISEAVFSRCLSSLKEERIQAAKVLKGPSSRFEGDKNVFIQAVQSALYASKIVSYAQGFLLMRAAAEAFKWNLNYGAIAMMWREGCIIRSRFLGDIKNAYEKNKGLASLLLDDFFRGEIVKAEKGWRQTVASAAQLGIPCPCFSSALAFFDGYRSERLPANLLQAQRDYFGAHTYERVDQPRGKMFHTNWTGKGGEVSSSSYNA